MSAESPHLILASTSPRRIFLLQESGYHFEVDPPHGVEESESPDFTPRELARLNALRKARAVALRREPTSIVLGADTVVTLDGRSYGKPRDLIDAARMISELQGRTHRVITAVCLAHRGRCRIFDIVTAVTFRQLDAAAVRDYLALIEPLDKAGAYAAQEHGDRIISRMQGSKTNVMGLPMEALSEILARSRAG